MEKDFEFRVCAAEDIEQLIAIGIETYSDTFAAMTSAETMAEYLAAAFSRDKIRGELAGYLKVNENQAQTESPKGNGLEMARENQKEYV